MIIESVFENQQVIPLKYTGEGQNISPPLTFKQVPPNTKSLALIVDDPDAPRGTFDHWIVWNISPHVLAISEGAPEFDQISVKRGINSYGLTNYQGPKPPPGKPHRYFFKLYALDIPALDLPEGSSKQQVEKAIQSHILEEAQLIGTYQNSSSR